MKNHSVKFILSTLLIVLSALPGVSFALQATDNTSIFEGYYSREGNNGTPTKTNHHNIYMKLYTGEGQQWVAMLHIPLPYASSVDPVVIPEIFKKIRKQMNTSAFIRDDFGYLKEKDGKFFNYVNVEVPEEMVCDLGYEFRGFRYWRYRNVSPYRAVNVWSNVIILF